MKDGTHVDADIIVTATGLNVQSNYPMSTMDVKIDGKPYDAPSSLLYKSMMVAGVPNFAFTIGYTSASWTLKADMTSSYVCRLLNHMDANGFGTATPIPSSVVETDPGGPLGALQSGPVRFSQPSLIPSFFTRSYFSSLIGRIHF